MDNSNFQKLLYSDPVEEILNQKDLDEDENDLDQYDDLSFGAFLDSGNDF